MAPAAADTIAGIINDLCIAADGLDAIVTGDLGFIGSELLIEYLKREYNLDISAVHMDCGKMIYYREEQDVHAGGSGCGCSASMLCSHFLNKLRSGEMKRIIFTATGALLSPSSVKQGESIPSIAHAVLLKG